MVVARLCHFRAETSGPDSAAPDDSFLVKPWSKYTEDCRPISLIADLPISSTES
jgi:hypothetical protein